MLCLLQVVFLLLAGAGETLLMGGNGAYLVIPVAKSVVLLWLGAKAVSGRRWAMITLIVLQGITLGGFGAQLLLSLFPVIGLTVNLAGLTTNVVLPIAVILLCARALPARTSPPDRVYSPPQDPFAPAPIVDDATTVRALSRPTGPQQIVGVESRT
jgi:hypothetical protein